MLAGNPLPGTGNQVEEGACHVFKYCCQGSIIWRIVLHIYDAEMQGLFPRIDDHDDVSNMEVSQFPEDGGRPSWPIQVSINNCTPLRSRIWAILVPAHSIPWLLGGHRQIAI